MTPKLSSVRTDRTGNLFLYGLERFRGVTAFYAVLMAVLGPLRVIVRFLAGGDKDPASVNILLCGFPLAMALVMPLLIFHYVNNRQALDIFHAAPVRRKTLYLGGYLAGLTIVLGPLAVFGGGAAAIQHFCFGNGAEILLSMLYAAISSFASYSLMVFVIINCGTMFESIIYYLVLNIGYPVLISSVFSLVRKHTYGYQQAENLLQTRLFSLSPYFLVWGKAVGEKIPAFSLLLPVAVGLAAAWLGNFLYRRRKSEAAGQSFAYQPLFFVGAGLTALSAGVASLALSGGPGSLSLETVLLANLVGITAYSILDTIRKRGFRKILQTAATALCISGGASLLLGIGVFTGVFGYEGRIPALEQIAQVQITVPITLSSDSSYSYGTSRQVTLEDPESIRLVLEFHQAMIREKQPIQEYNFGQTGKYVTVDHNDNRQLTLIDGYDRYTFDDGRYPQSEYGMGASVRISYSLKNGKTMSRFYSNYPMVLTKPLYRLLQTQEFRDKYYQEYIRKLTETGGLLEVTSVPFSGYEISELDTVQTAQLKDAMLEDMDRRPADFLFSPSSVPVYQLSMRVWDEDGYWNYTSDSCIIYESDGSTLALLRQWDALPALRTDIHDSTAVGYIPREKQDALMRYPKRDGIIFNLAGKAALYWEPDMLPYASGYLEGDECYEPLFVTLGEKEYVSLMEMITPIRFSETPGDVVIVGGVNYLVFPQYSEAVRSLILSAPAYEQTR